jgi:hypothetical protein
MIMDWSLLWLALHDQEDLNDELALIKVEGHRTATGSAALWCGSAALTWAASSFCVFKLVICITLFL